MDQLDLRLYNEIISDLYDLGLSLHAACVLEQHISAENHTNPLAETYNALKWAIGFIQSVE
jgi:hypothetical protein